MYNGYKSANLLSVNADAKTVKSLKKGILTGILYLAPHNISGHQVCANASEGCKAACIYSAGMGVYNNVQRGRINKTKWFFGERDTFMARLVKNIETLVRKAKRENLIPAIRLNGTSDIPWEKITCERSGIKFRNVMRAFPEIEFYDYTKIIGRKSALALPNYHLTFSLAEDNDADAKIAIEQGYNVAVVMNTKRSEAKPETWGGYPVVDGDAIDARFLDPDGGHVVALFAKGQGTKDSTGFVRDKNGGFEDNIKLKVA